MAEKKEALAVVEKENPILKRGITEYEWNTLESLYPGAKAESKVMVWDYCKARNLDPMKRPCHIVPMEVKDSKTGAYSWKDVVMPGVYELRTTAQRTGEYLGHSQPVYGPQVQCFQVTAPEFCSMTFYRWHRSSGMRVEFPVTVFFSEVVGTKKNKDTKKLEANSRWERAPIQMLTKCCESAGLREAFPTEIGGEHSEEEMAGQRAIEDAPAWTPLREPQRLSAQPQSTVVVEEEKEPATGEAVPPEALELTGEPEPPAGRLLNKSEIDLVVKLAKKRNFTDDSLTAWLVETFNLEGGVTKLTVDNFEAVTTKLAGK